jgi:HSP20 family protein
MTQTLDETIEQIENLYESVTGQKAPPAAEKPYATIPPEKDPEAHVSEQIEHLLDSLSQVASRPAGVPTWVPPIWACQGTGELLVNVDLPGVPKDALRVRVSNGVLQVSGTRTAPVVDAPRGLRYAEQPFGAFRRLIPIPGDVAADQVRAQYRDGVLLVRLPRLGAPAGEGVDIAVS